MSRSASLFVPYPLNLLIGKTWNDSDYEPDPHLSGERAM